jgi:hypothetical protein
VDTSALNPFPGLRPFEYDESLLFFGRDGQSSELLSKLADNRFVAVAGTSGSGKSSLVRAGLLPALYGGMMLHGSSGWRVALLRPGGAPIGNLARALSDPKVIGAASASDAEIQIALAEATLRRSSLGLVEIVRQSRLPSSENLLIVVDQFEELFRYLALHDGANDEATAFVSLLLAAVRQRDLPVYVALTMRSDYLGDCARFRELPESFNDGGLYLVPRLTRDQYREALTGPVAVGGGRVAGPLVSRLLNDLGDNPDQLPILQHAMMRTWDFWSSGGGGEPINISHYEAVGGMAEALSQHADEAFNELPGERSRQIAEKLFKALTEKGADNHMLRRPTRLAEICAIAEASVDETVGVIDVFRRQGRSFFMPPAGFDLTPETIIDISHESLVRNWKRLTQWVDEEAQGARAYQRLAETSLLYEKGRAGLLVDPALRFTLDWRESQRPNAAWARRYHANFESAMRFLEESKRGGKKSQSELEGDLYRRLKRTRIVIIALLLLLMGSLILSFNSARLSHRLRIEAETQRLQVYRQEMETRRLEEEIEKQKILAEQRLREAEAAKAAAAKAIAEARTTRR